MLLGSIDSDTLKGDRSDPEALDELASFSGVVIANTIFRRRTCHGRDNVQRLSSVQCWKPLGVGSRRIQN